MREAIAAGLFGVLAAVIGAWAVLHGRKIPRARVELVAISFLSNRKLGNYLDFKLRNTGGEVAVATELVVQIADACEIPPDSMPELAPWPKAMMPISHTYELTLPDPASAAGTSISVGLSQEVPANGTDRFLVEFGISIQRGWHIVSGVYRLRPTVVINGTTRLEGPQVVLARPDPPVLRDSASMQRGLSDFWQGYWYLRRSIERDVAKRGDHVPEWSSLTVESALNLVESDSDASRILETMKSDKYAERFADPYGTTTAYLEQQKAVLTKVISVAGNEAIRSPATKSFLDVASDTLARLDELQREQADWARADRALEPEASQSPFAARKEPDWLV
jgi:hypothetical protein